MSSVIDCVIQGRPIPIDVLGPFRESEIGSDDGETLRQRLTANGYLFLRGAIDVDDVMSARTEVFERLIEVGEIEPPAVDAIATGTSRREEVAGDLGQFWQSVSEGSMLRKVSHGDQIRSIMATIYGEPARPHDYMFLRPSVVGRSTLLHYDRPFFARGSNDIVTVWTALGDIPTSDGPLVIVENSNHFDDLLETIQGIDYDSKDAPQVQMAADTVSFARKRGSRLLTADFQAGDVVIFTMSTLHGTLDNHSPIGRTRLSCDVRWQPASDPVDPRYMGPNPPGTTGAGYGELNGAKPLTEDWHKR